MNIYVLFGEEQYIIDQELRKIITNRIDEENLDFAVTFYDCDESPVQIAIDDAQMMSLMMDHKAVVIKNAFFLTGQKQKKIEHNVEVLEKYIDYPNELTTLIMIAPYEKLDSRKKIVKKLKEKATIIEAQKLKEYETKSWIQAECTRLGVQITPQAVDHLYMMIGANLQMLSQELEKLLLYVGEKNLIDDSVVHLLVKKTTEQNVFTLIEKVAKKQFSEAHRIFSELITQQEDTIKIAAILSSQFSRMLEAKAYLSQGHSSKDIGKLLGIHPYAAKIVVQQAQGFHEVTLQRILHHMSDMDYNLKRGANKVLTFEMFLIDLKYA